MINYNAGAAQPHGEKMHMEVAIVEGSERTAAAKDKGTPIARGNHDPIPSQHILRYKKPS